MSFDKTLSQLDTPFEVTTRQSSLIVSEGLEVVRRGSSQSSMVIAPFWEIVVLLVLDDFRV